MIELNIFFDASQTIPFILSSWFNNFIQQGEVYDALPWQEHRIEAGNNSILEEL